MNGLPFLRARAANALCALHNRPNTKSILANGFRTINNATDRSPHRFENLFDNIDWNTNIILNAAPALYQKETAHLDKRRTPA